MFVRVSFCDVWLAHLGTSQNQQLTIEELMHTVNQKAERISEETILAITNANQADALIFEKLALRRLAELGVPPGPPPAPPNHAVAPAVASAGGVGALFRRILSIFTPVELVQQVGPGLKPLHRHEWERSKWGWASQNR